MFQKGYLIDFVVFMFSAFLHLEGIWLAYFFYNFVMYQIEKCFRRAILSILWFSCSLRSCTSKVYGWLTFFTTSSCTKSRNVSEGLSYRFCGFHVLCVPAPR